MNLATIVLASIILNLVSNQNIERCASAQDWSAAFGHMFHADFSLDTIMKFDDEYETKADDFYIGGGGFGRVFEATWLGEESPLARRKAATKADELARGPSAPLPGPNRVAVKVVRLSLENGPNGEFKDINSKKRLELENEIGYLRELTASAPLSFVNMYGCAQQRAGDELVVFLFMEKLDETFEDMIDISNKSGREQILSYASDAVLKRSSMLLQVVRAVKYLSDRNIVHMDIKPMNVLTKTAGDVSLAKLIDFGYMRNKGERSFAGSIPYILLADCNNEKASELNDIYSLAIMLEEFVVNPHYAHDTKECIHDKQLKHEDKPFKVCYAQRVTEAAKRKAELETMGVQGELVRELQRQLAILASTVIQKPCKHGLGFTNFSDVLVKLVEIAPNGELYTDLDTAPLTLAVYGQNTVVSFNLDAPIKGSYKAPLELPSFEDGEQIAGKVITPLFHFMQMTPTKLKPTYAATNSIFGRHPSDDIVKPTQKPKSSLSAALMQIGKLKKEAEAERQADEAIKLPKLENPFLKRSDSGLSIEPKKSIFSRYQPSKLGDGVSDYGFARFTPDTARFMDSADHELVLKSSAGTPTASTRKSSMSGMSIGSLSPFRGINASRNSSGEGQTWNPYVKKSNFATKPMNDDYFSGFIVSEPSAPGNKEESKQQLLLI